MWSSAVEIGYSLSIINPRIICHHSRKSKRIGAGGSYLFLLAVSLTKRQQMSPWSITSIIWLCPVTQAIRVLNIDAFSRHLHKLRPSGHSPPSPLSYPGVHPPFPTFTLLCFMPQNASNHYLRRWVCFTGEIVTVLTVQGNHCTARNRFLIVILPASLVFFRPLLGVWSELKISNAASIATNLVKSIRLLNAVRNQCKTLLANRNFAKTKLQSESLLTSVPTKFNDRQSNGWW